MSDTRKRLLAAAKARTATVRVGEEEFTVREIGAEKFGEYAELIVKDRTAAISLVLQDCVLDDETGEPCLSAEDAATIARSARAGLKLLRAVLDVSGFGEGDEKKADAT